MKQIMIRREIEGDFRTVETLVRDAFWNVNVPGCNEHYLAHVMRSHPDFIPELDLVAELDGRIVGNIMYTSAWLMDETGTEKRILTFGPLCVHPEYQRQGIGKRLLEASFEKVVEMGYDTVVIFGHPGNYMSRGFKSCKKYNVCLEPDLFPTAMLVKELIPNTLDGRRWLYRESEAYQIDEAEAEKFDKAFEPKEKAWQPGQEEFYIYSHSTLF